jgi:hypothetical protein
MPSDVVRPVVPDGGADARAERGAPDRSPRRRWTLLVSLGVALACGLTTACGSGAESPGSPWEDGSVHGPWLSVFDGEGTNTGRDGVLSLSPRPAVSPEETHAGLIVSTEVHRDVDVRLRMRTIAHLREGEPNPWEVAWVVWAYSDPTHFYYLVLKPNGWEIGKADPAYPGHQRFLATGSTAFPIGSWYDVRIEHRGDASTVAVDGEVLSRFTDAERPYRSGAVGVYAEDARAEFDAVEVRPLGAP